MDEATAGRARRIAALVSVAALAALFVVPIAATPAGALAVFAVETTADTVDAAPGDGLCEDAAGACSLRAAAIEANALGSGETVEIVLPAGTFTLTIPGALEDGSLTGDLDLDCCVTTLRGAGSDLTTIDANGLDRALHVLPNPLAPNERGFSLSVEGLTITGGSVTDVDPSGWSGGGGILSRAETLGLDDVVVRDNVVDLGGSGCDECAQGGGILTGWDAELRATDVSVVGNAAFGPGAGGGGAYVYGTMAIAGSTFSGNTVDTSEPYDSTLWPQTGAGLAMDARFSEGIPLGVTIADSIFTDNHQLGDGELLGGGFALGGALATIDRVTVTGNTATQGGGAFIADWGNTNPEPAAVVTESVISGNGATAFGGGIAVMAYLAPGVDVVGSTISGNTADAGGGISVLGDGARLRLLRSAVTGNTATTSGGGGFTLGWFATLGLDTTTVSGNSAPIGGGLHLGSESLFEAVHATIVANTATLGGGIAAAPDVLLAAMDPSTATVLGPQVSGADCAVDDGGGGPVLVSGGSNADSDDTCGLTDPTDLPVVDPLLGPLGNNGGPTFTLLPGDTSPLVDAAGACTGTDQRGVARPQGAACDIGAVEVLPATSVSGTVLEDGTGLPLQGMSVRLINATTNAVRATSTDASGGYSFASVAEGPYVVRFIDLDGLHTPEYHANAATKAAATTVAVSGTPVVVDGSLASDGVGSVRGTVTEVGSGVPLSGVSVRLLSADGMTLLATRTTSATGAFQFAQRPFGSYRMRFIDLDGSHVGEWHLDAATLLSSTAISHGTWWTTIDAALAPSG